MYGTYGIIQYVVYSTVSYGSTFTFRVPLLITEVAVHIFDRAARGPPLEIPLAELKTTF